MDCVIQTITFGVIAYNEQKHLSDLLADLLKQTYPKKLVEVILVDGQSADDTAQIMRSFQANHRSDFQDIKVFTNPMRIQPAGWNIVIKNSSADVLLRIDAHARLPEDFIEKNIACINTGEYVCGGPRENIIDEDTTWKRILLTAEQSMFGAGAAEYRQATEKKKYVKSVFHGAYRKQVIDQVGLFNEALIRTEDNEYHYRVRQEGYHICYDPGIHSYYQTRNSLNGMLKQKFLNGLWIGRTKFICPGCVSLFHLTPFAFVMGIMLTTILGISGIRWPAIILWMAYGAANLVMTVLAVAPKGKRTIGCIILPIIFLLLHVSYGVGTMIGIMTIPALKFAGGIRN